MGRSENDVGQRYSNNRHCHWGGNVVYGSRLRAYVGTVDCELCFRRAVMSRDQRDGLALLNVDLLYELAGL